MEIAIISFIGIVVATFAVGLYIGDAVGRHIVISSFEAVDKYLSLHKKIDSESAKQ